MFRPVFSRKSQQLPSSVFYLSCLNPCKNCPRNDLYSVERDVKPQLTHSPEPNKTRAAFPTFQTKSTQFLSSFYKSVLLQKNFTTFDTLVSCRLHMNFLEPSFLDLSLVKRSKCLNPQRLRSPNRLQ